MPVFVRWLLRLGPANPIAVRLVQNGSRRTRHLYIRSIYLGALIVVLLWVMLTKGGAGELSYRELAQAGSASFTFVAYLQVLLICVLAPVFMAGAIAQEANPRTWEVMLTTPLSPSEIVLGNLIGRLFFVLALLFASLPLFALVQYYGGVPGSTVFASYGVSGAAAVLVGTIAIALSVSRLVGRRAVFAFYVSVVSYLAVTAGIDGFLRSTGAGAGEAGEGVTFLTGLNPFLALYALLNPASYPRAETGHWMLVHPVSTWVYGALSLSVVIALASAVTVRAGGLQSIVTGRAGGAGRVPWYRKMFGLGASGAEHRPPRSVWSNPIAWREAAARNSTLGKILARWAFIIAGGAFGVVIVIAFHMGSLNANTFRIAVLYTVLGELAVTTLVAINMAATAVSREREDGTLDLLLTTILTPRAYLLGKLRGLIAYLLPMLAVPIGTLALAGLYVLFDGFGRAGGTQLSPTANLTVPAVLPEAALVVAVVAVPFMAFCVMVGLHWSLKSKGTISSVVGTVAVVGVVAGIVGACGYQAGSSADAVGAVLAALSPATATFAVVQPEVGLVDAVQGGVGLQGARIALLVGAVIAATIHLGLVYGLLTSMVRNFDFTVRKLAGTS